MISINEFNYLLPEDKIAYFPVSPRDSSKLLKYESGQISDHHFHELPDLLPENSFLVFNESKVIRARLFFETEEGKTIELFCLEPASDVPAEMGLSNTFQTKWNVLIGGKKKLKSNFLKRTLNHSGESVLLKVHLLEDFISYAVVEFSWNKNMCFSEILDLCGKIPLPPYINREESDIDTINYQTTYAQVLGSVAAPTAGLHFTEQTFQDLQSRNISTGKIVLHVGAGTFKPVKNEDVSKHEMHEEEIILSKQFLVDMLQQQGRIGAVGTTSLRTLESIYWLAEKIKIGHGNALEVNQWDDKKYVSSSTRFENVKYLIDYMEGKQLQVLRFKSSLLICPPYQFRMIDFLVTNFHQPKSTLMLLISALVGDDWKKIYQHALQRDYRFLSFGDSSVLFRPTQGF